jgi:integrase
MEAKIMVKTRFPGVYFRASEGDRMHAGKKDICFYLRYKNEGRQYLEKAGWQSEGYSAKLASQIRAERLQMIRHGQELPKDKKRVPKFSEMGEAYLEWAKENKTREGRDERYRYKRHLEEPLGNKKMNEISAFDLERLKSGLTKEDLAAGTVKHCLVLVREIFNKAIAWKKYQGTNPIKGVKLPSPNNRRERFLTYEEADLLLNELAKVSKTVHNQALLSLHCGLRAGEIFNLRGHDVDFENGLIRIMDPKNKANRSAYLTEAVRKILKERLSEDPNELVFKDRDHGGKMKAISKTFDRTVKGLGFNDGVTDRRQRVVFHTLRHTFGSWLAMQGTQLLTIKELLGHTSTAMTERYSHLIPDVKKRATLALEAAFDQSRKGTKVVSVRQQEIPA